jgi:serralysin
MTANFPFFDLTPAADNFTLTPGLLANLPWGLRSFEGNDTITGAADAEYIFTGPDIDRVFGGLGNDSLFGGLNNDDVLGEGGNDILNGNENQDIVDGGDGDDLIRGGQDDDLVRGGNGNDTLIGDLGADVLIGGPGSDVFVVRGDEPTLAANFASEAIRDFDPTSDFIGLSRGLQVSQLTFFQQTITAQEAFNRIVASGRTTRLIQEGLTTPQSYDPDGNGLWETTFIRFGRTGRLLAGFTNMTPAQLASRFIQVDI